MLTADTITDEQIRELRDSNNVRLMIIVAGDFDLRMRLSNEVMACETALINADIPFEARNAARARCAEILNSRRT